MSHVRINETAIRHFFERPGVGLGGVGTSEGEARILAARMVAQAKENASGAVVQERSGDLKRSVRAIVRPDPRTGGLEIGVGSTAYYAGYLEDGASAHVIPNSFGKGTDVTHPGNEAYHWLRKAVQSVIRGV